MRANSGLAAAVVLALAGLAQAGPFDAKDVSADAKWAAHLDVDALMASKLTKTAREPLLKEFPRVEAHLALVRNLFRFDPMTDLHSITIYGTQPLKKGIGATIIRAKVDQKLALDLVKTQPDHETIEYGKYQLHRWRKDAHKVENAAFFKPDVIVTGASVDELKAALDVLDGTKANISETYAHLASSIPPGTILIAGAKDLANAKLCFESPLSKQADSALLVAGESKGQVFARLTLNAKNAEVAKKLKTVADGALALAALVKSDEPDAVKLIDAVKVTLADKTITADGQAVVELLWPQIQKEIVKKKAEHEQKQHEDSDD